MFYRYRRILVRVKNEDFSSVTLDPIIFNHGWTRINTDGGDICAFTGWDFELYS